MNTNTLSQLKEAYYVSSMLNKKIEGLLADLDVSLQDQGKALVTEGLTAPPKKAAKKRASRKKADAEQLPLTPLTPVPAALKPINPEPPSITLGGPPINTISPVQQQPLTPVVTTTVTEGMNTDLEIKTVESKCTAAGISVATAKDFVSLNIEVTDFVEYLTAHRIPVSAFNCSSEAERVGFMTAWKQGGATQ